LYCDSSSRFRHFRHSADAFCLFSDITPFHDFAIRRGHLIFAAIAATISPLFSLIIEMSPMTFRRQLMTATTPYAFRDNSLFSRLIY
jgi:hypothetical protein